MMGWIEARLLAAERFGEYLYQLIQALQVQVTALQQALNASQQQQGGGGAGGTGSGFFVVMAPSSGTIDGTWSGSAPTAGGSFTGTVYQVANTGTINDLGTQTCVNWLPAALENSKACVVVPDQAGNYGVVSQSCT
jgi:hypothetical protein